VQRYLGMDVASDDHFGARQPSSSITTTEGPV